LSILEHLISCYKVWFELKVHLPKNARYTLGEKIDDLFIETIELIFTAQYLKRGEKLSVLEKANAKFDLLKFFLQILWETKNIETKHYGLLSQKLDAVGKMLGGWLRKLETEAAPPKR
jgi:hypothetical protein